MANIYDMADTWNAGGNTFTAIKMNVTDTASASASLLMDLQVAASSKFSVSKAGTVTLAGTSTTWAVDGNQAAGYLAIGNPGNFRFAINWNDQVVIKSDHYLAWSSTGNALQSPDTFFRRVAAGVVGVRGGSGTSGGVLSFIEQTAPAAPAANGCYVYAQDNGGGKTQLMALFSSGAAQQLAIEP